MRLADNGAAYLLMPGWQSADDFHVAGKLTKLATSIPAMLAWGGAIAMGMLGLVRYQMKPARQGEAPRRWPKGTGDIARAPGRFTLVMTLHPRCPCSRASLRELTQLLARAEGQVDAHVLFVKPRGAPADWCDGDLWKLAKDIPGVHVAIDNDARDSAILRATTSGQVFVYDAAGAIRFSGGITGGRGHEGDNIGLSSVLGLIRDGHTAVTNTPVYGCELGVCQLEKQ
jgi:hypothetical protein